MANTIGKLLAAFVEGLLKVLVGDDIDKRSRLSVDEDDDITYTVYDDGVGNEYTRDSTVELRSWNDTPPD